MIKTLGIQSRSQSQASLGFQSSKILTHTRISLAKSLFLNRNLGKIKFFAPSALYYRHLKIYNSPIFSNTHTELTKRYDSHLLVKHMLELAKFNQIIYFQ